MQDSERNTLILNVDDSDGARYAKSRVLRLAGFTVIEASNGTQALQLVKQALPTLVLLDTKLPDLSGFEVCSLIKADPLTEDVLVLQTSASFLNSADKIRALDGGADNYLVEPIESDELIANVNALLRLRRVKQKLSESEMRFRQIAENIADVFWIFAPHNQQLLYVSPAYATLWQRDSEQLLRDPGDWLNAVHEEDRARVSAMFSGTFGSEPLELTYRLRMAGGGVRWIRDRAYPVRNKLGEVYRVARVSQDVSERVLAEEALNVANRRKDEFLATLAHELRNPLGPILHSIELLKTDASPQRVAHSRPMIERHTRHLMRLVDDLLDISRVTQGKVTIRRDRVRLAGFVATALEAAGPFLESRRHEVRVSLPEQDIWLDGDAVRLAQIVGNVLLNAGKYTAEGGLIELHARLETGSVVIAISDNGIGIAPENHLDIFDLFVQADHSPDRAQDGLGIGLSLVRTLTQLHEGSIRVFSAGTGQGSRFEITLPVADAPAAAAKLPDAAPAMPAPAAESGRRILIVDDNLDSSEALAQLLALDGFVVATEADGPAALRHVAKHAPPIIFLDIGLPGMTGYQLAEQLRLLPEGRDALLIALTGYGQQKDRTQAFAAGFDHHLVKPADLAQLRGILAQPRPLTPAP